MDFSRFFDSYNRHARLYPALLTLLPATISLAVWFPAEIGSLVVSGLVMIFVGCGVLYGLSTVARSRGKAVERRLLQEWGGWPTTHWLRHSDQHLPRQTKGRYHAFLQRNVPGLALPTAEAEQRDLAFADEFYASAVQWLKERCRGKDFSLVEKENAEYGFRRNLRGLKGIGVFICIAAAVVNLTALAVIAMQGNGNVDHGSFLPALQDTLNGSRVLVAGTAIVDVTATILWLSIVKDAWVREAADHYARALLACCDSIDQ